MDNRFSAAISKARTKLETIDSETCESLDKNLDLTFDEHFEFQQTQARAHAMGKITTDEAQVLYVALGEIGSSSNGGWAKNTDLATKVVVTQIIGELLAMRIAGKV